MDLARQPEGGLEKISRRISKVREVLHESLPCELLAMLTDEYEHAPSQTTALMQDGSPWNKLQQRELQAHIE